MSTPQHIVQLTRLDDLCKEWTTIHSQSCNLFSSLVNILIQRQATSNILNSTNSTKLKVTTNTTIVTSNILDQIFQPQTLTLDISTSLSNLYITRIVDMYEKELTYKRNLIFGGSLIIDHSDNESNEINNFESTTIKAGIDGVKLVAEKWAAQPYLEFEIEEEIVDRVKIWKKVKEFEKLNK
ncbi:21576_t:CDS:2 [Dentiscutata erythropus]|uniref:21576_t:CDS:1 n=1 Tax=Dentiscutata erythropus TaxID=1348616 RepID=A0A9N9DG78_9GLOM|nr:21576_t:CDS:2 [Dentiscutata erythropus]